MAAAADSSSSQLRMWRTLRRKMVADCLTSFRSSITAAPTPTTVRMKLVSAIARAQLPARLPRSKTLAEAEEETKANGTVPVDGEELLASPQAVGCQMGCKEGPIAVLGPSMFRPRNALCVP